MENGLPPAQGIELLRKKSLTDEAFELLHQRIVAGRYTSGEWLRQEELSNELGVSQTPVREALDRLSAVGLTEKVPYKGVRVRIFDPATTIDAYVMRLLLETAGARLAIHHSNPAQIAHLRTLVNQTQKLMKLDDMSTLRQLNLQIHRGVVAAGANTHLLALYEQTVNIFPDWMLYEYMFRHPELLQIDLELEFSQHLALIEAIAARDADAATQQVLLHLHHIGTELVNFLGLEVEQIRRREMEIAPLLGSNWPTS